MKPSGSIRPDFCAVVEIGRQRQARDSLVSVRCTPRSSSGCSLHQIDDLREPGARHHDRAGGDEALPGELDEGAIGAVAHADVVDVRDQNRVHPADSRRSAARPAIEGVSCSEDAVLLEHVGEQRALLQLGARAILALDLLERVPDASA